MLCILGWVIRPSELAERKASEFLAECVDPVGALPLANLRLLRKCNIAGLKKLRAFQSFKRKLHEVQKKMGLVPAEILSPSLE